MTYRNLKNWIEIVLKFLTEILWVKFLGSGAERWSLRSLGCLLCEQKRDGKICDKFRTKNAENLWCMTKKKLFILNFWKKNFLLFSNFSDFFFFRCIIESLRLTTRKLRFDAKIAPSSGSKIIRKFSCFKFLFFGVWHHYMIYTVFIHFTQWNANKFRWTLPFWNFSE